MSLYSALQQLLRSAKRSHKP